jgi:looped-hinge helix DNA binding domain, AbrB family
MTELTLTAKGQITIRKALLEGLGAKPGDRLKVEVRPDGGLVIPPLRRRQKSLSWDDLAGSIKPPKHLRGVSIDQMNETIAKGWAGQLEDND